MGKKLFFSLICIIFFTNYSKSQVAYYDATTLKAVANIPAAPARILFQIKDSAVVWPILIKYAKNSSSIKRYADLITEFDDNPFFTVEDDNSQSLDDAAPGISTQILNAGSSGGIGNINVTDIADALAKFLIKRAKQELLISFINKLDDSTKFPEFGILFPNTKLLLGHFNTWEYPNAINTLREAFNKDVKQLMGNIPNLSNLYPCSYCNDTSARRVKAVHDFFSKDKGRLLISALAVGNGFSTGQKIPDIIHSISGPNYLGGLSTLSNDELNIIKLVDILSYSVRNKGYNKNYISPVDFATFLSDGAQSTIYFGLLYQQLSNANIQIAGKALADIIKSSASKITGFINSNILTCANLSSAIKNLITAKNKSEYDLSTYWESIFENADDFFQTLFDLHAIDPSFKFSNKFQSVLDLSTNTLEIANDISVKNYSAAIVSLLNFISQNLSSNDNISDFESFFVKYASFAANLIQAKNSDDAENAIESVALPAGSSSIKRQSSFNIALNAYLGGFYGNEYLAQKTSSQWSHIAGVYAPIGITFSKGINKNGTKCKVFDFLTKGASISVLLNVIDIGAIASYRLQDSTTAKLPDVTLQNILAPGVGIIYGIPGWPLSIGWSEQLGPALRSINASTATTSSSNYRRQFFLTVDIPIFNFYTQSK